MSHSDFPLDRNNLPRHVAVIMDGNGRWAKLRGLPRIRGHVAGVESVRALVTLARKLGVSYLTLFAFSEENWHRPSMEIRALMALLRRFLQQELPDMLENGIALRAIGDLKRLPPAVQRDLAYAIEATAGGEQMVLTLALSYGARSEIVHAVQSLAQDLLAGKVRPQEIDAALFTRYLYTVDLPDPDLLIRTSGEFRLSNFLLWQSAYTELYVTETLWPDFREEDFIKALTEYQQRERRYGLTQDQIAALNSSNSRH